MNPNPLSSLNHFTVPVGIGEYSSTVRACSCAQDAAQSLNLRALALLSPVFLPARPHDRSRSSRASVVETLQPPWRGRSAGGGASRTRLARSRAPPPLRRRAP